jgi:hypothetical protein
VRERMRFVKCLRRWEEQSVGYSVSGPKPGDRTLVTDDLPSPVQIDKGELVL